MDRVLTLYLSRPLASISPCGSPTLPWKRNKNSRINFTHCDSQTVLIMTTTYETPNVPPYPSSKMGNAVILILGTLVDTDPHEVGTSYNS